MKEKIKDFVKPTLPKVAITFFLVGWQYFYSYQNIRLEFLNTYSDYATKALSSFNWGNYFVRNLSLFVIWIIVAIIIFFAVWLSEAIFIKFHNFVVKRRYSNQPEFDYNHLLKDNISFLKRLSTHSVWFAGIIIVFISLFALSDLFERFRFSVIDSLYWKAYLEGATVDFGAPVYVISSFVALAFLWYLVAMLITWLFDRQRVLEKSEKISEEHFAVEVDT